MVTWLAAIWKAFLGTKAGRCLAAAGGFLLALAVFALYVWRRATQHQADKDEAKDAAEQVKQAQVAQETYQAATDAVEQVRQDAAKQPAPDAQNRTDFDDTF